MTEFVSSLALSRLLQNTGTTRSLLGLIPRVLGQLITMSLLALCLAEAGEARSIFLNGIDISNARNQSLEGVDIRIDSEGNVFIIGNHYEIHQQQPLPPLVPKANLPNTPPPHKPRAKRPAGPGGTIDSPAGHPPLPPRRTGKLDPEGRNTTAGG